MSFDLERARRHAAELNAKLAPIANAPVDVNDPHWVEKMQLSEPLDELGIRTEAEALLTSLLNAYAKGTSTDQASIRDLLHENAAFAWATHITDPASTAEGLRLQLLSISARWRAEDPRDLMLSLKDILDTARAAGVSTQPVVSEIAALSDDALARLLRG